MMLGLARPDAGTVQIYGKAPARAIAHGEIAAVMQTGGLLKDFTVAERWRLLRRSMRTRVRPTKCSNAPALPERRRAWWGSARAASNSGSALRSR